MRILAHLRAVPVPWSVTMCQSRGRVCTSACRAIARADRDRTATLARSLPR
jgi:hypothetical protein